MDTLVLTHTGTYSSLDGILLHYEVESAVCLLSIMSQHVTFSQFSTTITFTILSLYLGTALCLFSRACTMFVQSLQHTKNMF